MIKKNDKILYTIGHSTLSIVKFRNDLEQNGVTMDIDVRRLTGSDAFPWFNENRMRKELPTHSIGYLILHRLHGRRPKQKGVDPKINGWWNNQSFHNYADYAMSKEFAIGLNRLKEIAKVRPTAIMCAEAVPWRCHRRIIADHMIAQGWTVFDIMSSGRAEQHQLPSGAVVHNDGMVTYPAEKPDHSNDVPSGKNG